MTAVPGLAAYPGPVRSLTWTPLGAAGGFSGAEVVRGSDATGPLFALKVWPPGWSRDRLLSMHARLSAARAAGLAWVPGVLPTTAGATVAAEGGRLIDITTWVPGAPAARPDPPQVAAVGRALARLAWAWRGFGETVGPAPAVARRLEALRVLPPEFAKLGEEASRRLEPWRAAVGPIRAVHGDLRADHVFFGGNEVSGVIDFGAAGFDHPAVDLARYAADVGPGCVQQLCAAYARADAEQFALPLVAALAFAGLVVAAARWSRRPGEVAAARAAERLAKLAAWQ